VAGPKVGGPAENERSTVYGISRKYISFLVSTWID
jgi:hypothetical protein